MKLAFFSIKTQFENVGDALINRELIKLAARSSRVFIDSSRCPKDFLNSIQHSGGEIRGVTWIGSSFLTFLRLFWYRANLLPCYYYLSPGGYRGEHSMRQFITAFCNTLLLYFMYFVGVRIVHVGVSYENIGSRHRYTLLMRSGIIYKHLVRDTDSKVYAQSLGLRVDGVMPDLAFGACEHVPSSITIRNEVAFSFRVDQDPALAPLFLTLVRKIAQLAPPSWTFAFIIQVERDKQFLSSLRDEVGQRPVEVREVYHSIAACFDAYRSARFILSNRLHSLLMGSAVGCCPVPIVDEMHNKKIIGLFDSLGESNRLLSIHSETLIRDIVEIMHKTPAPLDFARQYLILAKAVETIYE